MNILEDLVREVRDLRKQVEELQRLEHGSGGSGTGDVTVSGTPAAGRLAQWTDADTIEQTAYPGSAVTRYSGVPVAGNYAYWTGDGTVANSGFGTSQLPRYSGTPTAGAITYWTGAGTVTGWTFGTADVFLLSTSQTVTGAKTFDNNTTIAGTATAGTAFAVVRNLAGTATNSPVVSIIQDHASDDQAALIVQQDGTGPIQEWYDGATRVGVFLDGGLLGIGPGDPLVQAHIVSEASAATRGVLVAQHTGDAAAAVVFFRKSRGTKGSPSTIVNGDYGGALAQQYYDGTSYRQTAAIVFRSNGAVASNSMPTDILFAAGAADDPNITNERMRVTSAGNVGIGTSSPQGKLHVHDGTGGQLFVTKTAIDASAQTIIPNGTGDVVQGLFFLSIVKPSTGAAFMTSGAIANNSNADVYNSGGNILNLRVNSDGSVDVRRTGGSLTYTLSLFMIWL